MTGEDTRESRWPWAVPTGLCSIAVTSVHSDHSYPPPGISLSPMECVEMWANVTIQCCNHEYGVRSACTRMSSAPVQHKDQNRGGTATFTLFAVTPADMGNYRCPYLVTTS